MSALRFGALAAAVSLSFAACTDPLPAPVERTFAYVVLPTQLNSTGDAYVLRPSALFFRTSQLSLLESANAPDQCADRPYVPHSTAVKDTLPTVAYLNAGAELTLGITGTSTAMPSHVDDFGKSYYGPTNNAAVPFTPGDVATITVPGSSGTNPFPALSLSQTTVTPFTFDAVPATSNDVSGGLKLTWTPPPTAPTGVAPTGMLVSLRYASAGTGTPDREIFCSLVDDGSFLIVKGDAAGWFTSQQITHAVSFTRWRGEVKQVGNVFTSVVSALSVPTAAAAP
ncbi:MAG TPA: hypothetical protein VFJ74_04250 [Gemmatimonadaceae bacterium]|nr:hypothetical protein [Gemmatimonadaceae bacterium]